MLSVMQGFNIVNIKIPHVVESKQNIYSFEFCASVLARDDYLAALHLFGGACDFVSTGMHGYTG